MVDFPILSPIQSNGLGYKIPNFPIFTFFIPLSFIHPGVVSTKQWRLFQWIISFGFDREKGKKDEIKCCVFLIPTYFSFSRHPSVRLFFGDKTGAPLFSLPPSSLTPSELPELSWQPNNNPLEQFHIPRFREGRISSILFLSIRLFQCFTPMNKKNWGFSSIGERKQLFAKKSSLTLFQMTVRVLLWWVFRSLFLSA